MELKIRVHYDPAGGHRVEWSPVDEVAPTDGWRFTVLRAPTESGPFEEISGPLVDVFTFFDALDPSSHRAKAYYKLRVVDLETGAPTDRPDVGLGPGQAPSPEALHMARRTHEGLRFNGRACLIWPAKTFGPRCDVSFSPVSGRKLRSGCHLCFDRAFVGGYHAPVLVYSDIDDAGEDAARGAKTPSTPKVTRVRLPAYPTIPADSVLLDATGRRWRLTKLGRDAFRGFPVEQQAEAHLFPQTHIVYQLPTPSIDLADYDLHAGGSPDADKLEVSLTRAIGLFK